MIAKDKVTFVDKKKMDKSIPGYHYYDMINEGNKRIDFFKIWKQDYCAEGKMRGPQLSNVPDDFEGENKDLWKYQYKVPISEKNDIWHTVVKRDRIQKVTKKLRDWMHQMMMKNTKFENFKPHRTDLIELARDNDNITYDEALRDENMLCYFGAFDKNVPKSEIEDKTKKIKISVPFLLRVLGHEEMSAEQPAEPI